MNHLILVYDPDATYFIEEYIKNFHAILLLSLLGFVESGDSWKFPENFDIVTIEHLERAKLFSKRQIPPTKNKVNKPREAGIKLAKEDGLKIKSAQYVLDSSDHEGDDEFFAREKALRERSDVLQVEQGKNPLEVDDHVNWIEEQDEDENQNQSENETSSKRKRIQEIMAESDTEEKKKILGVNVRRRGMIIDSDSE